MAKIQYGVKPDIFERTAQKMAKISGGAKIQDFGPPLRPKKCFQQSTKWGRPKIDEKNRVGQNTDILKKGRPKKGQNSSWSKTSLNMPPDVFVLREGSSCFFSCLHVSINSKIFGISSRTTSIKRTLKSIGLLPKFSKHDLWKDTASANARKAKHKSSVKDTAILQSQWKTEKTILRRTSCNFNCFSATRDSNFRPLLVPTPWKLWFQSSNAGPVSWHQFSPHFSGSWGVDSGWVSCRSSLFTFVLACSRGLHRHPQSLRDLLGRRFSGSVVQRRCFRSNVEVDVPFPPWHPITSSGWLLPL